MMPAIWDLPDFDSHEAVHVFDDRATGLKAIIAVHSTYLGPAAGGTRFWHYADSQAAVTDALRQVGAPPMDMPFTPAKLWAAIQAAPRRP